MRNPFPILITQCPFNADPPHLSSRGRAIGYQVHTSNGYFTKISQQARPQRCGLTKHYPFTTPSLSPSIVSSPHQKNGPLLQYLDPLCLPPRHIHTISLSSNAQISLFSLSSHYGILTKPNPPPTQPTTPPPQKTPHSTSITLSAPKKMPFSLPSPPRPPQPTPRTLLTYLIHLLASLLHLLTPPQEQTPLLPLHRPSPRFPWFHTSPPRLHPPTTLLARRIALRRARRA